MKRCNRCGEEKPLVDFHADRSRPDGHAYACKPCKIEEVRAWKKRNPERYRSERRALGLTADQFEAMLEQQGGNCAICGERESRSLAVDHDHQTGRIRGLLCSRCNLGLGHFKDEPARLQAAIRYLDLAMV